MPTASRQQSGTSEEATAMSRFWNILFVGVLVFNLASGLTIQELGIPGVIMIKFAMASSPPPPGPTPGRAGGTRVPDPAAGRPTPTPSRPSVSRLERRVPALIQPPAVILGG
jgi:hypothetical protein